MHDMKRLTLLLFAIAAGCLATNARAQSGFFKPKTQMELVLGATSAKAGSTVMAGLKLQMPGKWHTYWRSPGEVGKPTEIKWKLPAGITAGEIRWPVPKRMISWDLVSFEYSHEVVLLIPLTIGPDAASGLAELKADVTWLECETDGSCVPGKGSVSSSLKIGDATLASPQGELLAKWQKKLPETAPDLVASARWEGPAHEGKRPLLIDWETANTNGDFWGYHFGTDWQLHPATEVLASGKGKLVMRKRVDLLEGSWPSKIAGIFVAGTNEQRTAFEKELIIEDKPKAAEPALAAAAGAFGDFPTFGAPNPLDLGGGPASRPELLLSATGANGNATVLAALKFTIDEHWHCYWRNPGNQYGLPIEVEWNVPDGVKIGTTRWMIPHRREYRDFRGLGDFNSYEYAGEAVLITELTIGSGAAPGARTISADLKWAECKDDGVCVPRNERVETSLTIGDSLKPAGNANQFAKWQSTLPRPLSEDLTTSARWEGAAVEKKRFVQIEVIGDDPDIDFFPYEFAGWQISSMSEVSAGDGGHVVIRKEVTSTDGEWPTILTGILVNNPGSPNPTAQEFEVTIGNGGETQVAPAATPAGDPQKHSLIYWLMFAFIGGMILNIMPCVLPVISLKILGFVNQAEESPGRVRQLGFIYTLGVLCSFMVLAAVIIGVQKAGGNALWGMQFSNPAFVICLTTIITLVALNLFGVFEITLTSGTMTAASSLASKHGSSGAFFNGVLTTVLATPCSAPFLIGALGFAFTQPPSIIVLVFGFAGLGLAFPYLLLSWNSRWLKFLPKPGNWMVRFKEAMGFPMLITAFWLLSLSARRFGLDGVLWIGFFLVMVAMAAWVWGAFVQRGTKRRGLAMAIAAACLVAGYFVALEENLRWRDPAPLAKAGPVDNSGSLLVNPKKTSPDGIEWYKWSHAAIEEARAKGHPVLVDFTAKWCVTCRGNKTSSIEIASTRAKLKEGKFISLIADFTDFPPDIAEELIRFQRPAVPMVLVYPADLTKPPAVLPTLLTPGIVHDALDVALGSDS
jgi:thiol:disulfide interchange protein/DsbC/DsbD-like thiol-disulfide interchange protein